MRASLSGAALAAALAVATNAWAIGPERLISTAITADKYSAQAAYNSTQKELIVVWHNTYPGGTNRDVYARRLSRHGELLSWFAVSPPGGNRSNPSIAFNPAMSQYLVVWMYDAAGDGTRYAIRGKIIPSTGPGTNPEINLLDFVNVSIWNPSVVWNAFRQEFLLTWDAFDVGNSTPLSVNWARISQSGAVLGYNIVSNASTPHQSSVAYNVAMDGYLVVWRRLNAGSWDIDGQRLSWQGGFVGPPFSIASLSSDDKMHPDVTTNTQDKYFVSWQQYVGSDWDIYGVWVNSATAIVSSVTPVANSHDDETRPAVDWDGIHDWYAVAYQQNYLSYDGIFLAVLDSTASQLYKESVAWIGLWNQQRPTVAASGNDFLVAYESLDNTIWGRMFLQLFYDGFESGTVNAWSSSVPP